MIATMSPRKTQADLNLSLSLNFNLDLIRSTERSIHQRLYRDLDNLGTSPAGAFDHRILHVVHWRDKDVRRVAFPAKLSHCEAVDLQNEECEEESKKTGLERVSRDSDVDDDNSELKSATATIVRQHERCEGLRSAESWFATRGGDIGVGREVAGDVDL